MLKSLKVRNFRGYNFDITFDCGSRNINTILLNHDKSLFASYQVNGEYNNKLFHVFTFLVAMQTPDILATYCQTFVTEESSVEVKFYLYDTTSEMFIKHSYYLLLSNSGVVEEEIDGVSFKSGFTLNAPDEMLMYFKSILFFDFSDPVSLAALRRVFIAATKMNAFIKFYNQFMFGIMNYPKCEIVAIDDTINVLDSQKQWTSFDLMDTDFRTLSYLAWALHISFLKTGVLALANLDYGLSDEKIEKLLVLFNDPTCILMNPAQLIFSTKDSPNLSLFPEQQMQVQKVDNKFYVCSWQNF